MKFRLLLEELLTELSGDEIYQKFYKDIPYDEFRSIALADPQTKEENGRIIKPGKFTKLLIQIYKNKKLPIEDLPRAKEYLQYVYKYNPPVDINKIKELADIYNIVKGYIVKETMTLSDAVNTLSEGDYKLLHNGENWLIYTPKSEKAACALGINTEWCTTWGPYSFDKRFKDRQNHFQSYNNRGPLYIAISKADENTKYQFHFETEQYMDKNDKRIRTDDFLDKNQEIKFFFFPSFVKENLPQEETNKELNKMDVLSNDDSVRLLDIILKKSEIQNELVKSIMETDDDKISELVKDSNLDEQYSIDIDKKHVTLVLNNMTETLDSVQTNTGYYESELNNSWNTVYNDVNDRLYNEDDLNNEIEPIFKEYYEAYKGDLRQKLGISNYDRFKQSLFRKFAVDSKEKFVESITDLSTDGFEQEAQSEIDAIEKHISFDYPTTVMLNKVSLIKYLMIKNVHTIGDQTSEEDALPLDVMLEDYVSHYKVDGEYEGIYNWNMVVPKYKDHGDFARYMDDYFEKLMEDNQGTMECMELRKKLGDIEDKFFGGKTEYENEHAYVKIVDPNVDCEKQTVEIIYQNKDTGQKHQGDVKVDNLTSYLTNLQLFEANLRFKRMIKD